MARPEWLSRDRVLHFAKFGTVGLSGVALNALLFWLFTMILPPQVASPLVFVICGQCSFFAHAFLTWRDARERRLSAAWALFTPANWAAGGVNYTAFSLVNWLGAWTAVCYIAALAASVPFTYVWNAIVVFPKETMPKERIQRLWLRLVEWNNQP